MEKGGNENGFVIKEIPKSTKEVIEKERLEEIKQEEVLMSKFIVY